MLQFLRIALYVIVGFALLSWLFPSARQRADRIMRTLALALVISAVVFFVLHFWRIGPF